MQTNIPERVPSPSRYHYDTLLASRGEEEIPMRGPGIASALKHMGIVILLQRTHERYTTVLITLSYACQGNRTRNSNDILTCSTLGTAGNSRYNGKGKSVKTLVRRARGCVTKIFDLTERSAPKLEIEVRGSLPLFPNKREIVTTAFEGYW